MKFAEKSYKIFEQSVADYHIDDDVDAEIGRAHV